MVSESNKKLGVKKSVIRDIFEYAKKRKAEIGEDKVFDFSIGNPSVPAPQIVTDSLIEMLGKIPPEKLHAYTSAQGDPGVRQAIADYVKKCFNVEASADLIYITVGAAAALTVSLNAVIPDQGGDVIVFAPFFPEYRVFTERAGGTLVTVKPHEPDLQPDLIHFEKSITEKTRAVIINSPNNPSGAILTSKTLEDIASILSAAEEKYSHPIYLISDEPYRELVYDGKEVPFVTKYYRDTIVSYSFSKSLSLPGERIGYILVNPSAQDAEDVYAAILGAGRSLGFVCAPSLFQFLIPKCLGKTSDIEVYRKNRDLLYGALTRMGYSCVYPDGAFYLFVKALEDDTYAFCEKAKKHELLLVPSDDFGYGGYVRIAYCLDTEVIKSSLPSFEALMEEYRSADDI